MSFRPVVLIILDGFGRGPASPINAIWKAKKPNFEKIENTFPMTNLQASGIAAGLPWGQEGNSEVGHLNLGSGKIIYQYLPRIVFAIRDGTFFENEALLGAVEHAGFKGSLHFMGLLSSGTVHSYIDHVYALLDLAKLKNLPRLYIHAFTDGRDAPPFEGGRFIKAFEDRIKRDYPFAKIASVSGRFYAMDRDNHWERTKKVYELLTAGQGPIASYALKPIEDAYKQNQSDEFVEPTLVQDPETTKLNTIKPGDAVIFFNFREDSVRQLTRAFVEESFDPFERPKVENLYFVTMTRYQQDLPTKVAFEPVIVENPLAKILSDAGKTQIHFAETEKYAHVTYFFNGGIEEPFKGEERELVTSRTDYRYAEQPEMSGREITERIIASVNSGKYDLIVANFANADMVGHTGDFDATVKAIEFLDTVVGKIQDAVLKIDGALIITADHGNADEKINPITGEKKPEHSGNPVPFYLITNAWVREKTPEQVERERVEIGGILADVAPTILELMNIPQPPEMTGQSLLKTLGVNL